MREMTAGLVVGVVAIVAGLTLMLAGCNERTSQVRHCKDGATVAGTGVNRHSCDKHGGFAR